MEVIGQMINALLIVHDGRAYTPRIDLFPTDEGSRAFSRLLRYLKRRQGAPPRLPFQLDPVLLTPPPYSHAAKAAAEKQYHTAYSHLIDLLNRHVPVDDIPRLRELCGPGFRLPESSSDIDWRLRILRIRTLSLFALSPELSMAVMHKYSFHERACRARPYIRAIIPRMRTTSHLHPGAHRQLCQYLDVIETLLFGPVTIYRGLLAAPGIYYTRLAECIGVLVAVEDTPDNRLAWAIASHLEDNLPTVADSCLALKAFSMPERPIVPKKCQTLPRLPTELWTYLWKEFVAPT